MNTVELYNLSAETRAILAALDESGGELTPDLATRLEQLERLTEDHVLEMALACRELAADAQAAAREKQRLATRERSRLAAEKTLRDAIADHMAETGCVKVKGELLTVSLQQGPVSYQWLGKDENIPEPYRKVLTEYRVDQDAVKRDVQDGKELPDDMKARRTPFVRIS